MKKLLIIEEVLVKVDVQNVCVCEVLDWIISMSENLYLVQIYKNMLTNIC